RPGGAAALREAAAGAGAGEQRDELASAVSRGGVHATGLRAQDPGEGAERFVARLVTGGVVVLPAEVQVEDQEGEGAAAAGRSQFAFEVDGEVAAVGEARERVGEREHADPL